jgi:hypothetical protein
MKDNIDDLLRDFFRSEEQWACRILGRAVALARIRALGTWRRQPTAAKDPSAESHHADEEEEQ